MLIPCCGSIYEVIATCSPASHSRQSVPSHPLPATAVLPRKRLLNQRTTYQSSNDATKLGAARLWIQRPRGTLAAGAILDCPGTSLRFRWRLRDGRNGARRHLFAALVVTSEDHFARGSLMHGRHRDVDRLVDHFARAVHHHHRAVVEVRDALIVFLAFAQDENAHGLARQHNRL